MVVAFRTVLLPPGQLALQESTVALGVQFQLEAPEGGIGRLLRLQGPAAVQQQDTPLHDSACIWATSMYPLHYQCMTAQLNGCVCCCGHKSGPAGAHKHLKHVQQFISS